MTHTGFTLGTVFIGALFLVIELAHWYPGYKALTKRPLEYAAKLGPFAFNWCVGALMAMSLGGVVGWATDWFIWGSGWLGDGALVWGLGGYRQAAPQGLSQPLTQGGLFVTGLVIAVAWIRMRKGASGSQKRGLISGVTLGLSAGVAAVVAVPLASAVNMAGFWATGTLS